MSLADIRAGSVIRYPYLWDREAAKGETEGRKDRPTVVILRLAEAASDRIILLPITTKQPTADRIAVELPDNEKRSAGLDVDRPLWLVLDECNQDNVRGSYYLRSHTQLGTLSKGFLLPVLRTFAASWRSVRVVPRR